MRKCKRCGEEKPLEKFPLTDGYRRWTCTQCISKARRIAYETNPNKLERKKEVQRLWHEKNPERSKELNEIAKLKRYGLTPIEYTELLEKQGGVCAVCGRENDQFDSKTGISRRLHVDHSHTTNKVRGLLCYGCNVALAMVQDSQDRLLRLVDYLRNNE